MNKTNLGNHGFSGSFKRRSQGPTMYQPNRNEPELLNQSGTTVNQKPWNYNTNPKISAVVTEKMKIGSSNSKSNQSPAGGNRKSKPEWDPFFWKTEAHFAQAAKNARRPLSSDSNVVENGSDSINFLPIESESHRNRASWEENELSTLNTQIKSPPNPTFPPWVDIEESKDHGNQNFNENYQHQDEMRNEFVQNVGTTNQSQPKHISTSSNSMNSTESVRTVGTELDPFVVELADMNELVEFLMYKCASDECLQLLPELIQELNTNFRSLVKKYIQQKSVFSNKNNHNSVDVTKPEVVVKSPEVNLEMLDQVVKLHKDLEIKNENIVALNQTLNLEIDNLKQQVQILEETVEKFEVMEEDLRTEITSLKENFSTSSLKIENLVEVQKQPFEMGEIPEDPMTIEEDDLEGAIWNSDLINSNIFQPITADLLELKVENEALKLMNLKLRHEAEINNRILGLMELKYLCHNFSIQGTEVRSETNSMETTIVSSSPPISGRGSTYITPVLSHEVSNELESFQQPKNPLSNSKTSLQESSKNVKINRRNTE